jgi:hypothetical protein
MKQTTTTAEKLKSTNLTKNQTKRKKEREREKKN